MGSTLLHKSRGSQFRISDVGYVIYRGIAGSLDGVISKGLKMAESNPLLFILTIFGVPAGIYAYFLQVSPNFDLVKGIILLSIGALTGAVLLFRYIIKAMSEWKEFRKKYYGKK